MEQTTLTQRIREEVLPCSLDALDTLQLSLDAVIASLDDPVELLGFGEALHGGEEILQLRNVLFQHLVAHHGYCAVAIESSFPRARLVNEYVHGRGPATYDAIKAMGFGQGVGDLDANRELVEWMRTYNADPGHGTKLSFYGFDIPTGATGIASPKDVLLFALDYLTRLDSAAGGSFRERVLMHVGDDGPWENPAVYMDPSASIALQPAATALRTDIEDLIMEFRTRRPDFVNRSNREEFLEALRYVETARELLNFHVAMGLRKPGQSPARVLGTRDALMADHLAYIADRERARGKVLVFAHNSHLQRGLASWPGQKYWGTEDECTWWPAGSLLADRFGDRYAVIASAVIESKDNQIGPPEPGSLEALFATTPGPIRFMPTHRGNGPIRPETEQLPTRTGSVLNPTYVPLNALSFVNFDALAVFDTVTYNRGGMPLQAWQKEGESQ